jgi:hypothetical protein
VRVAHAHGVGSPTHLEVPVVIDLLGGETQAAGSLQPPAGSYCELVVNLGPADSDAVALPGPAWIGSSLRVTTGAGEGATAKRASFRVGLEPRLVLDAKAPSARIAVSLGAGWSETLGGALDEDAMAGALLGLAQGAGVTSTRPE